MKLWFKSSPSFREKLAEREESIALRKLLFHSMFFNVLNIGTIKLRARESPSKFTFKRMLARGAIKPPTRGFSVLN